MLSQIIAVTGVNIRSIPARFGSSTVAVIGIAGVYQIPAPTTGKAPLQLLPPLILHDRGGEKHRPEVEAILRGEAALGWL